MCVKCLRKARRAPARSLTFGQIKARAQDSLKGRPYGGYGIPAEKAAWIGIEAHMFRIEQARTKRCYRRHEKHRNSTVNEGF